MSTSGGKFLIRVQVDERRGFEFQLKESAQEDYYVLAFTSVCVLAGDLSERLPPLMMCADEVKHIHLLQEHGICDWYTENSEPLIYFVIEINKIFNLIEAMI